MLRSMLMLMNRSTYTPGQVVPDLTTYSEVDPNGWLSRTSTVETVTGLRRTAIAYAFKNYGSGFFSTHTITEKFALDVSSCPQLSFVYCAGFALEEGAYGTSGTRASNGISVSLYSSINNVFQVYVEEYDGGVNYSSAASANKSLGTTYYLTLVRDPSVGTYGTAYLYIYSDANRTTLLDTLTLGLHGSVKSYSHHYTVQSYNDGNASTGISMTLSGFTIDY